MLWVTVISTHNTSCVMILFPLKGEHFEWVQRRWSETTNTSQVDVTPGVGKALQHNKYTCIFDQSLCCHALGSNYG